MKKILPFVWVMLLTLLITACGVSERNCCGEWWGDTELTGFSGTTPQIEQKVLKLYSGGYASFLKQSVTGSNRYRQSSVGNGTWYITSDNSVAITQNGITTYYTFSKQGSCSYLTDSSGYQYELVNTKNY